VGLVRLALKIIIQINIFYTGTPEPGTIYSGAITHRALFMATLADTSRTVLSLKRKSDTQTTSRPVLTINKKHVSTAKPKPATTSQAEPIQLKPQVTAVSEPKKKEPIPDTPPLIGPRQPNAKMRQFLSMYKLIDNWPHIFDAKKPLPLAIGIHLAIMEDAEKKGVEISEWEIKTGIWFYTKKEAYLKALIKGEHRYDLHGVVSGDITPEQKEIADKILYNEVIKPKVARRKKNEAKKAAADPK
jgi:hypothetical protein